MFRTRAWWVTWSSASIQHVVKVNGRLLVEDQVEYCQRFTEHIFFTPVSWNKSGLSLLPLVYLYWFTCALSLCVTSVACSAAGCSCIRWCHQVGVCGQRMERSKLCPPRQLCWFKHWLTLLLSFCWKKGFIIKGQSSSDRYQRFAGLAAGR